MIYWFRTPPGIRVGRTPLDDETRLLIEQCNPGVDFNWPQLLKGEAAAQPAETRPRVDPAERRPRPQRQRDNPPPPQARAARPEPEAAAAPQRREQPAAPAPPPVVAFVTPAEETAAFARLGAEGVTRLRSRYAEIIGRIAEKIADEAQRTELKSQAERLNPDNWTTPEAVAAGLEQYEAVFDSLRSVVGARRKRRRRSGGETAQPSPGDAPASAAEVPEPADDAAPPPGDEPGNL